MHVSACSLVHTYIRGDIRIYRHAVAFTKRNWHNTGRHGARVLEQPRFTIPSFQISWEERFWRHPLLLHLQACGLNTIIDNNTVNVHAEKVDAAECKQRPVYVFDQSDSLYEPYNFHPASTFLFAFFK